MNIDLVIFDMDGVIFEGHNFWLDLHRAMGTEADAWRLWHSLGRTDYARLGTVTVEELWRGRSAAPFFDLISARRYVPGVFEVFGWLREQAVRTAIVSTGPYQLAERAQKDLNIDRISANRVDIADGHFAGTVDILVDENRKDQAALEVMSDFGVTRERTAMVGDAASDVGMAEVVALPIAYDASDPALVAAARAVLPAGQLAKVVDILSSWPATQAHLPHTA